VTVNISEKLTIWIPTYNRPRQLRALLRRIKDLHIYNHVKILISDNHSPHFSELDLDGSLLGCVSFERRPCNLSAGANFLRAFESVDTDWIHIMSDDDDFCDDYLSIIVNDIQNVSEDIVAIKYDTDLYGHLNTEEHNELDSALSSINGDSVNSWFNNLLLISGWVFRRKDVCRYISHAYLGYGTKLSHILPVLKCCDYERKSILFSSKRPIRFIQNTDGWPKAATWVEMVANTQLGHSYISEMNRLALHFCLFGGSTQRLAAKILRIRIFYTRKRGNAHWIKILAIVGLLSPRFFLISIIMLPFLLLPTSIWPEFLRLSLGNDGSSERW
jgi:hypothetical protein